VTDTAGDNAADEDERLSLAPTPDDGVRLTDAMPWDESTRPHRRPAADGPSTAVAAASSAGT